jgi:3',5'-cyclic AMP phosphodiesterase CpdA
MPPVRLLQVSDLHMGTRGEPEVEDDVRRLVFELEPELVVASGDLTHRNRRHQHELAASFLRSLGRPLLVVPGNHDIPMLPPARLARSFAEFERIWGETEPVHKSDRLVAVGLNTVVPWWHQRGRLRRAQLERAGRELGAAPRGALRAVVVHHHLPNAPWRTGKRHVPARTRALEALAAAGAELVVAGHVHQSVVVERRELRVVDGAAAGPVLAVAPGMRRPRAWRPSEVGGLNVYEADDATLRVVTYAWAGEAFVAVADRRYPRGAGRLEV